MPKITVYTAMLCPYCSGAKKLLAAKSADFEEIDVTFKPSLRQEMTEKAGGRTSVPQIWIGDRHIGGYDELSALDAQGELDALLAT